jgi:hypothetical protein
MYLDLVSTIHLLASANIISCLPVKLLAYKNLIELL